MSPALNGNAALERFECSNAVEIHNGIMFDFYPGLSCSNVYVQKQLVQKQLVWYVGAGMR